MRIRIVLSLVLIALAVSTMARDGRGQQPAGTQPAADNTKSTPVLKTPGQDVTLPVTVRDKKGGLVTSVQAGDLSLSEEGRPQTIKSLTRDSNQPFRVGLLVETSRPVSGGLEAERKAADKFVDLILPGEGAEAKSGAGNQAFLIHFDREVELLEDFTGSREKLHQELDDMGPSKQAQNDSQGPETTGEDRGDRPHGARNASQLYDAIFLASDEVMASKDGRKALVLFSDGVDHGSKDRLNEALDAAEKAHVEIYTVYFKGEQERSEGMGYPGGGRRGGGYPGGGGGYPGGGYPGGGGRRGGNGPTEAGVDGKKIMQQIADRTGGHAFEARKKEDLEAIYNLVSEELHSQFLLTYTPDKPDNEGGFHKVAIKATKEDLAVSAPEGYFAPGGDSSR